MSQNSNNHYKACSKALTWPADQVKQNFVKTQFGNLLSKFGVASPFQPAIYTVVHEESESEVPNIQIPQENLKLSILYFQTFYLFTRSGDYIIRSL